MDWTKEKFEEQIKSFTELEEKQELSEWGEGYLYVLRRCKNLILFGVNRSEPIDEATVLDSIRQNEWIDQLNDTFNKLIKEDRDLEQSIEDKTLS